MDPNISARELQYSDIPLICQYWLDAKADYVSALGVDLSKMPESESISQMLQRQLESSYPNKESYATIWLLDGLPIGHCNVNKIIYGKEAYMHLHLWKPELRHLGIGTKLVQRSLSYFFENLNLKSIYCEPYAENIAPHHTLQKAGFEFVKTYRTIPGSMNFEQEVHQWRIDRDQHLANK